MKVVSWEAREGRSSTGINKHLQEHGLQEHSSTIYSSIGVCGGANTPAVTSGCPKNLATARRGDRAADDEHDDRSSEKCSSVLRTSPPSTEKLRRTDEEGGEDDVLPVTAAVHLHGGGYREDIVRSLCEEQSTLDAVLSSSAPGAASTLSLCSSGSGSCPDEWGSVIETSDEKISSDHHGIGQIFVETGALSEDASSISALEGEEEQVAGKSVGTRTTGAGAGGREEAKRTSSAVGIVSFGG